MLQYLLNATAIWLISLISYDIFLKKESYHSYNRFYLLLTFLLGVLLPLVQWQGDGMDYIGAFRAPVDRLISTKGALVSATAPASASGNWQQWLFIVYLVGVLVALSLVVIDIVRLLTFYRNGKKSMQDGWTIICTGKEHAPFSFRNLLFVSSIKQYNADEWHMILAHEKRHTVLLHVIDLLLMQAARIVLWFHPLVYVYNKRLLLVHEYQADNAAAQQPQGYGKFLIEQALLQSAPSLAHSFNRSPIKNRIVMLTRRSTAAARAKMLVFVPLALVCIVCFSKNAFSQKFERNGNKVTYRGNTFELSEPSYDTVILIDPVTANEITKIMQHDPSPIKMNGKTIQQNVDKNPYFTGSDKDLRDYLLRNMKDALSKLPNGQYRLDISNIVIDENGKVAYFDYSEMQRIKTSDEVKNVTPSKGVVKVSDPAMKINIIGNPPMGNGPFTVRKNTDPAYFEAIDKNTQQEIFDKVCRLMEVAPAFHPGTLDGKKVISIYHLVKFWNTFKIENNKVYDMNREGEYNEL